MKALYEPGYLSPQAKESVAFNSVDLYWDPPRDKHDDTVTDAELQSIANAFVLEAKGIGLFLASLNGKPVLLTQTGSKLHKPPSPPPNSLDFNFAPCSWCTSNREVWSTTQYIHARLTQLVFRQLERRVHETKVVAWAYWGNVQQPYWQDPVIGKTWGDVNHGVNWLTWPIYCINSENLHCPNATEKPWPTYAGMVYIKLANGDFTYVPDGAPSWWPKNEQW